MEKKIAWVIWVVIFVISLYMAMLSLVFGLTLNGMTGFRQISFLVVFFIGAGGATAFSIVSMQRYRFLTGLLSCCLIIPSATVLLGLVDYFFSI